MNKYISKQHTFDSLYTKKKNSYYHSEIAKFYFSKKFAKCQFFKRKMYFKNKQFVQVEKTLTKHGVSVSDFIDYEENPVTHFGQPKKS